MAEWKHYRLDQLCEFSNGFAFKSTDYVIPSVDTIEVFRMGYIRRGGGFQEDSTPVFVPRRYGKNLDKYLLREGDIVIAMTDMKNNVAILGNTAQIRHSRRFVLNQRVGCIRVVRPDVLDPQYLYYYSNWSPHVEYLRSRANSGVQVNLSTSSIKEAQITVPSLAEQHAIAAILGTLDAKIELNRRNNETLEAGARAIFKDWFVDFGPTRAKAEGRVPYLAPEIWTRFPDRLDDDDKPMGWKNGCLGDVARNVGESVKPNEMSPDTPYIGLEHMPRHSIALNSWEGAGKVTSGKLAFHRGDFLFGKLRPYFHKVGIAPLDGICSTDILVLGPKTPSIAAFVLSCISTDEFVAYTDQRSGGTKMPRTSWEVMARYPLCLPSEQIAQAFQHTVAPMLDRIILNIHEASSLVKTRDLLLPKLMSGEIRIREAEKIVRKVS
jgi:type I restriction enzyme S subunit